MFKNVPYNAYNVDVESNTVQLLTYVPKFILYETYDTNVKSNTVEFLVMFPSFPYNAYNVDIEASRNKCLNTSASYFDMVRR